MERMARNDYTYTHGEANDWLSDFVLDVKKMVLLDKNYQPFTMERLQEWSKHRADIETCVDYDLIKRVNLQDYLSYEHDSAIIYFNQLVIDLKLMVLGEDYEVLIEERVMEADKHFNEITRCKKKRTRFYR